MAVMEAIWRCPRFEQIVHLWNTCPECEARPSIKEELRVMARRRRLVSVGPTVVIYWWGEGVEELEGTLNLRTMGALRRADGVGYRSGHWTVGWIVMLLP